MTDSELEEYCGRKVAEFLKCVGLLVQEHEIDGVNIVVHTRDGMEVRVHVVHVGMDEATEEMAGRVTIEIEDCLQTRMKAIDRSLDS